MLTLHASAQTHGRVLPQPCPLEATGKRTPSGRDETKTADGVNNTARKTGMQQRRGEIAGGSPAPGGAIPVSPSGRRENGSRKAAPTPAYVAVLGRDGKPLMPAHPARVKKLLGAGRAVVASRIPFVIRLKDRKANDGVTAVPGLGLGIDPGSKSTGMAVFIESTTDLTGGPATRRRGIFSVQIEFRGHLIHSKLVARAAARRARRHRKTRHRAPRFKNRRKPQGWLPPSLAHRVNATEAMTAKLRSWFPITRIYLEYNRFDTQLLETPNISGVQYQRGTLSGYNIREFLLEKWRWKCAYCDGRNIPLTIDHIRPRSHGGSNRVSNLTLACVQCNHAKGSRTVEQFVTDPARLDRILAFARRPYRDAAAVNSTMPALIRALERTAVPVTTSSGARTKYNRERSGLPKSHCIDALASGPVDYIDSYPMTVYVASATGHGQYQRTKRNPYRVFTRVKRPFGFATGDHCRAVARARVFEGRVAVRASGSFNIRTEAGVIEGIHYKHFTLLQRNNGWGHGTRSEARALG